VRASRRENPAAALGRHARAETVAALAHQFARLIGSFHGIFSAARNLSRESARRRQGASAPFRAAYTKGLHARQCDARELAGRTLCIENMRDETETSAPNNCAKIKPLTSRHLPFMVPLLIVHQH
jgi:hypothetical protein